MAIIALKESEGRLRAQDLAVHANMPVPYLQKMLRRMVKAGLLVSERGHGGGFRLARPASRIFFIDVFEALELPARPKQCVFGLKVCSATSPCVLHFRWNSLNEGFQKWACETSLEDVRGDVGVGGELSGFSMLNAESVPASPKGRRSGKGVESGKKRRKSAKRTS